MLLQSIELQNFRQFINEKIDFSTDPDRNVTLIIGENGTGKTTFAQAFFWCLYGETDFTDKIMLNRILAEQMTPDQKITVKVVLKLIHGSATYEIIRTQEYKKSYSNKIIGANTVLNIAVKSADGNTRYLKQLECEAEIKKILPKELSNYFFFDGERIEKMSKEIASGRKSSGFSNAVVGLTGLKATLAALGHLAPTRTNSVMGKFNEAYTGDSSGKIQQLSKRIDELQSELEQIAKRLVEIAEKEGCDAICHGCTGKGNDQVRFELAIKAFAPDMPIIAPWREWSIKSREEEIDYAEAHNVPLKINRETNYSKDKNLWHLSHEGLDLEDAGNEPLYEKPGFLEMGVSPLEAPDKPTYITLDFEKGVPVALNEKKMSAKDIILALNKLGGENGIGLLDIVENRLVGMKCRGVYETPGGEILYFAHNYLETLCLDKMTAHKKQELSVTFAELVYNGQWFTPLREALSAFVDKTQETVSGEVKLKIYKGNVMNAGVRSEHSLYSEDIATFGEDDVYDQYDSQGFINLYGLPIKVKALLDQKKLK